MNTPENQDDLVNPFEAADAREGQPIVDPNDIAEALSPALKKKIRAFAFYAFRAVIDGKLTPREREGLKARLRDLGDELFR